MILWQFKKNLFSSNQSRHVFCKRLSLFLMKIIRWHRYFPSKSIFCCNYALKQWVNFILMKNQLVIKQSVHIRALLIRRPVKYYLCSVPYNDVGAYLQASDWLVLKFNIRVLLLRLVYFFFHTTKLGSYSTRILAVSYWKLYGFWKVNVS